MPNQQELAKDALQLTTRDYIIPLNTKFYEFMVENILRKELERSRRILVTSMRNAVSGMTPEDKEKVLEVLQPTLLKLLEDTIPGVEGETMAILTELGEKGLTFEELLTKYISKISNNQDRTLTRQLILRNHNDKIPRVHARLLELHREADPPTRSTIQEEFSLLR